LPWTEITLVLQLRELCSTTLWHGVAWKGYTMGKVNLFVFDISEASKLKSKFVSVNVITIFAWLLSSKI